MSKFQDSTSKSTIRPSSVLGASIVRSRRRVGKWGGKMGICQGNQAATPLHTESVTGAPSGISAGRGRSCRSKKRNLANQGESPSGQARQSCTTVDSDLLSNFQQRQGRAASPCPPAPQVCEAGTKHKVVIFQGNKHGKTRKAKRLRI
ncbi:MAG: hypothetical protein ACE5D0_09975 [Fidelibacterota bacterium]